MGNEVESSETTGPEKKEKKSKTLLIIIVILLVLLIGTVAGATALLLSRDDSGNGEPEEVLPGGQIAYEAGVITSEEQAKRLSEAEKVEAGTFAMELSVVATSLDGQHFDCYIANAAENFDDVYLVILDENDQEIYRSGLIPVGSLLQSFEVVSVLPEGDHECTLIYHRIAEDHSTELGTIAAGLTLSVHEPNQNPE